MGQRLKTTIRTLLGIAIAPLVAALTVGALLTLATMLAVELILPDGSLKGSEVEHDPY